MSATFTLPHADRSKTVAGDVYAGKGQFGRAAHVNIVEFTGGFILDQEDSRFGGEFYYRYVFDNLWDDGFIFKLAKIERLVEVGYTCIIYNFFSAGTVVVTEDSGTTLATIGVGHAVKFTAKTAGVPDTWIVSFLSGNPLYANFIYVDDEHGNDTSGTIGRIDLAFKTLGAADTAAIAAGGTHIMYVRPGAYTGPGGAGLDTPTWYFAPGAIVTWASGDLFGGSSTKEYFIHGYGDFTGPATTSHFIDGQIGIIEARKISTCNILNINGANPAQILVEELDGVDFVTTSRASVDIYRMIGQSSMELRTQTNGIIYYLEDSTITTSTGGPNIIDMDIWWVSMPSTLRNITISADASSPTLGRTSVEFRIHNLECTDTTAGREAVSVTGSNVGLVIMNAVTSSRLVDVTGQAGNSIRLGTVICNTGNSDSLINLATTGDVWLRYNKIRDTGSARTIITASNSSHMSIITGNDLDNTSGTGSALAITGTPTVIASMNRLRGNTATVVSQAAGGTLDFTSTFMSNSGGTNYLIDAAGVVVATLNELSIAGNGIRLSGTGESTVSFNDMACTSALSCFRLSGTGTNYIMGSRATNVGTTDAAIMITDGTSYININNLTSTSGECVNLTGGATTSMDLYVDEASTAANARCVNITGTGGTYGTITLGGRMLNSGASFAPVEVAQVVTGSFRLVRSSLMCGTTVTGGLNNTAGTTLTVQIQGRACSRAAFTGPLTLIGTLDTLAAFR